MGCGWLIGDLLLPYLFSLIVARDNKHRFSLWVVGRNPHWNHHIMIQRSADLQRSGAWHRLLICVAGWKEIIAYGTSLL